MFRPKSAYFFEPGIWFGDSYFPPFTPPSDRLSDVVATGTVPGIGTIEIQREGLIWLDFTGTDLCGPSNTGQHTSDVLNDAKILTKRAQLMTAHSTCVAKARFEQDRVAFAAGTVVSSSRQIIAGGAIDIPNSTDAVLQAFCQKRWNQGVVVPYWETFGGGQTTRHILSEDVAKRSIFLFAAIAGQERLISILNFLVRAEASLADHEFTDGLIQGWTAIEMGIDKLWDDLVDRLAPKGTTGRADRRRRLQDDRTYSASVRIEMLQLANALDLQTCDSINLLRKARNDLLHLGTLVGPDITTAAVTVAAQLLKIAFNYETPVAPNWSMRG